METPTPARRLRRIAVASMTGTVIEFYDFFIFGTAAAIVFNRLFFPELGAAAGTAIAFATSGVAFIARPFGSILFGHFGDRVGRKVTLVTTLLLMGAATVAIGLLPTAETIGAAAPFLLVLLRLLQGIAVGGEWAGAALLAGENAPAGQRGRYGMFPQLGPSVAFSLSSATFLVTSLTMDDATFLAWGWRVPFLLSALLVGVGLYVRLYLEETPVFRATTTRSRMPVADLFRHQWREVVLASLAVTASFAFASAGLTFLTSYGTSTLDLPRREVLASGIVAGLVFAATTAVGAVLSDRFGRRRLILIGQVMCVGGAIALFPILDLGGPIAFVVGVSLILGVTGIAYGPLGAQLTEVFATRFRYTGAGMAYNIGGVLGGAVTPVVAVTLAEGYGGMAVGIYLTLLAAVSFAASLALGETSTAQLDDPHPGARDDNSPSGTRRSESSPTTPTSIEP